MFNGIYTNPEVNKRGASFSLPCAGGASTPSLPVLDPISKDGDEECSALQRAASTSSSRSEVSEGFLPLVSAAAALGCCEGCTGLAHQAKVN